MSRLVTSTGQHLGLEERSDHWLICFVRDPESRWHFTGRCS